MTPEIIPDHVSGRKHHAERMGTKYESVPSLAEALTQTNYALIMEGDYGGQIYATCPVELIACDEVALSRLLFDLDSIQNNLFEGCHNFFEFAPIGSHVVGGMGGAEIISGVWCHDELNAIDMASAVISVILGRSANLVIPTNDQLEQQAQNGNVKAQYFLAQQLFETDRSKSIEWYVKAAKNGHLQSMSRLSIYSRVDLTERIFWLKKLASLSDHEPAVQFAQLRLATALDSGKDLERDPAAAVKLYERYSRNRYSATVSLRLAKMYRDGEGVAVDRQRALAWLMLERSRRDMQIRQNLPTKQMTEEVDHIYKELHEQLSPQAIADAEKLMEDLSPSPI